MSSTLIGRQTELNFQHLACVCVCICVCLCGCVCARVFARILNSMREKASFAEANGFLISLLTFFIFVAANSYKHQIFCFICIVVAFCVARFLIRQINSFKLKYRRCFSGDKLV